MDTEDYIKCITNDNDRELKKIIRNQEQILLVRELRLSYDKNLVNKDVSKDNLEQLKDKIEGCELTEDNLNKLNGNQLTKLDTYSKYYKVLANIDLLLAEQKVLLFKARGEGKTFEEIAEPNEQQNNLDDIVEQNKKKCSSLDVLLKQLNDLEKQLEIQDERKKYNDKLNKVKETTKEILSIKKEPQEFDKCQQELIEQQQQQLNPGGMKTHIKVMINRLKNY